jgi:hypothetical protein
MISIAHLVLLYYTIGMLKKLVFSWIGIFIISLLVAGGIMIGLQLSKTKLFPSEQEMFLAEFTSKVKSLKYDNIKPYIDEDKLFANLQDTYKSKLGLGGLDIFLGESFKDTIKTQLKNYIIQEYESGKLLPVDLTETKPVINSTDNNIEVTIDHTKGQYKLFFEKQSSWKLYKIQTP